MNDIWDLVKDIEEDLKGKEYCIPNTGLRRRICDPGFLCNGLKRRSGKEE